MHTKLKLTITTAMLLVTSSVLAWKPGDDPAKSEACLRYTQYMELVINSPDRRKFYRDDATWPFWEKRENDEAERLRVKCAQVNFPSPRLGMSKAQVRNKTNWGAPESVNRTVTGGRVSEQWVYSNGGYLYFTNGRLTGFQD